MSAKLITGTHHVSLKMQDEASFMKVVVFYRDLLGLDTVRSWGEGEGQGIMLTTGNSIMEISASGGRSGETGSINHFALTTQDVDACVARVREAGYVITVEPKDAELPTTPPYKVRVAFCVGPAGEEIEFFCER